MPHAPSRSLRSLQSLRAACLLTVMACALCLPGCTSWGQYWRNQMKVGPEYLRPPAPVESEWIDSNAPQIRSQSEIELLWWEQFNDPVLNGLVLEAYNQNLSLRDAGFRVLASRAAYNIKVGGLFPQTQSASAGFNRYQLSNNVGALENLSTTAFSVFHTGFNLSWELDLWGKIRRGIESAEAQYQASVEDYDGVLVTLVADVADRYTDYRVAQKQVTDLHRLADIQRNSLQLANDRFAGGVCSELDVSQAQLNLADTLAIIPSYQQQSRKANNALCVLLGTAPEQLATRLGEQPIPLPPPVIEAGLPAELLRRRPDVRQAERNLAAQSALIGVAESDLYPALSINGYIGVYANEIGQLFESDSLFGFAAPMVDWKVLNYGRLLNNIRKQDATFQSLAARYQQTVLKAGHETEDAIITFIKSNEAATMQKVAVEAASRSTELVAIQYREGATDFNRVFVVERNHVNEQIKLNDDTGDIAHGMIQLYRALGGGWQLRLDQLATVGQCCLPLPAVQGGARDDYIGKQPPAGFDSWCLWREWFLGRKAR